MPFVTHTSYFLVTWTSYFFFGYSSASSKNQISHHSILLEEMLGNMVVAVPLHIPDVPAIPFVKIIYALL